MANVTDTSHLFPGLLPANVLEILMLNVLIVPSVDVRMLFVTITRPMMINTMA